MLAVHGTAVPMTTNLGTGNRFESRMTVASAVGSS
jgi:hypothetical protein